uniref:extracellular matrix protein FRAS1 isoform X2 n=1 Tax=Ciona intestinalis TaxID=7719 RepID=UPI000EF44B27|nr:extracellular matrix protein FRAS1 isoform X2 [Ciona intestinalis]|eukprot:XP_026692904.1 extracellular matrix protein FRAS1 isoform X2 [Ciona intestinalis]
MNHLCFATMETRCFLFILLFTGVTSRCIDKGIVRSNNSTWSIDSCTACRCTDNIIECKTTQCKDPLCDEHTGEALVVPANQCCPTCTATHKRHCTINGTIVAHNTQWKGPNCTECRCLDGATMCTKTRCTVVPCGYGQVLKHLPGECCRKCVSIEESCHFEGKVYRDDVSWSISKCERAYCSEGEVIRYIADCDPIICGGGETAVVLEGDCCPTCVGRSCIFESQEYSSGQQFRIDACRQCVCNAGEVTCRQQQCDEASCPQGQRKVTREGSCCPECVSIQDHCDYHGERFYDGDLRNVSSCEVAFCTRGNLRSLPLQCSPISCQWNERLVHTSCCPECVPVPPVCYHDGVNYRDGDVWRVGKCTRCECNRGVTQCFEASCPTCPTNSVPVLLPGECCPDCQLITCHTDCATCDAPGYAHCTSCPSARLLQDGKCVRKCQNGFYQDGRLCKRCHTSCSTCTASTQAACTSCTQGSLLQDGVCVRACDVGFYRSKSTCTACPSDCSSCTNATSCTQCIDRTKLPQGGVCVQTCSDGFFFSNLTCQRCHPSCATCYTNTSCLTCPPSKLLENKLCVSQCNDGYFQLSITRCASCHPSCLTCRRSTSSSCSSCKHGTYLHQGKCVDRCPGRYYVKHGRCRECHSSCRSCVGGSAHHCTVCSTQSDVIETIRDRDNGVCVSQCEEGRYLDGNLCKPCHDSCSSCVNGTECKSCKRGTDVLVIMENKQKQCVSQSECRSMGFRVDSLLCHNGTSTLSHCDVIERKLMNGRCVKSCSTGFYEKTLQSGSICLACGDGCDSCQSINHCDSCQQGMYLSPLSNTCVADCGIGRYQSSEGTCELCPPSCLTCTLSTFSSQPTCTSCKDADLVLQSGQCVAFCIQQHYTDEKLGIHGTPVCRECDFSCTRCSGPSPHHCLQCPPDYLLYNGTCLDRCLPGTFLARDSCWPCNDENCLYCANQVSCSHCRKPFVLYDGYCRPSCPRGTPARDGACIRCSRNCMRCQTSDTCDQCDQSTYLMPQLDNHGAAGRQRRNEICVKSCGRGYFGNKHTRICEMNRDHPMINIQGQLLVGIGSRAPINMIQVHDRDTDPANVNIEIMMLPANGRIELDGNPVFLGDNIPYHKMEQGAMWFVHDSAQERHGVATFRANDRQLVSDEASLEVAVVSKIPPVVTKVDTLVVSVGQSSKITPTSCFDVRDDDNADDVTISIIDSPKYGHLSKLPNYDVTITSFKIPDLRRGVIIFTAQSNLTTSNITHDKITLQINDGYYIINQVIDVNIMSSDELDPMLVTNTGTRVRTGGMTRITNQQLQTVALDVKDKSKIVYIIEPGKHTNRSGELIMMIPTLSDAPVNYRWIRDTEGHFRSPPITRFTQHDIDTGRVWYQDYGGNYQRNRPQALDFEVFNENRHPAAPITNTRFQVTRIRPNIESPHLARGVTSPPQMSANDGRITVLHSGYLHYTDDDTSDRNILYNITRSLPSSFGTIEHADHPYVPITLFSQSDIDSNKIMYRPPLGGVRSVEHNTVDRTHKYGRYHALTAPRMGSPRVDFEFTVSDGMHILPPVNFTIRLTSGTTAPPTFSNQYPTLDVVEGGVAAIGEQQLSVNDPDTLPQDLIFTLVKLPRHGTVIRNDFGTEVREGDTFSSFDVEYNNLHYIHNGDGYSDTDQLQVSVTDVTHTITKVIQISILRSMGPTMDTYCELTLVVSETSEVTLSRENLAYVEQGTPENQIVYHVEATPRHGLLFKSSEALIPGATFTQEDITRSRIRYHNSGETTTQPLTDTLHFYVTGATGKQLLDQVLTITITPGVDQPPVVSVGSYLIVNGGEEKLISPGNIMATDPDTAKRDLIINVVQKPRYGKILNTISEERLMSHSAEDVWFTMQDILDGGIYYKPSKQRYLRAVEDYFTFRVTDGENTSNKFRLNITIQTVANEQPQVETRTLLCREGQAVVINTESLDVNDPDTPRDQITITMTSQLLHGKLIKSPESLPHSVDGMDFNNMEDKEMLDDSESFELEVGSTFTYQDIIDRKICYESLFEEEVSRRKRDSFQFMVSDGSSRRNGELFVEIEPELEESVENDNSFTEAEFYMLDADEGLAGNSYVVEANEGLSVEKGSVTPITRSQLRITSSNEQVVSYAVTRDPNVGRLQLMKRHQVTNLTADGNNHFNQEDIDMGYLQYNHSVLEGGGDVFFMFDVVGGYVDLHFNIHINEDTSPPRILVNNGLTLKEGGKKKITTRQLSATDDSGHLVYNVIKSPKLGRLQLSTQPGESIIQFNQDNLVAGIVQYVHTSDTERTDDEVRFSITDGTNSIVQTFHISVLPIDNSLPILENHGIRVQEGVRKTITEFELKATDKDTNDQLITFRIVDSPQHGAVERTNSGRRYVPVESFTMDDIYESRISYNHDGTNSVTDSFSIVVMDGTNDHFKIREEDDLITTNQEQVFRIEIVPVDDGTPRLITNLGLNHLEFRDGQAIGDITRHSLLTEDIDTDTDLITYHITSTPRHGRLESTINSGIQIDSFTQADINSGLIRYVLLDQSSGTTRDSFMFNVRDSLPNVVTGNTFNIRWSIISFEHSNYTVNEEAGQIDITVVRKGNLNQYAIVLCRTEHGTATSANIGGSSVGQVDYIEHGGQVQFDEHESEKVCSVQLNDDTTYEGMESFTVELTMPTYALLGDITRTSVFVTDELDKPTLQFVETQYTTEERDSHVYIPIKRTGDVDKPVTVICFTQSVTATGSSHGRIESGSDYKSRERNSGESLVTFEPGVSTVTCDIKIIDDSVYELSEEFTVHLAGVSDGAQIGNSDVATVTITGPNDAPSIFLTNRRFVFQENSGTVDIPVHRQGTDLSQPTDVWCSTKENNPPSAIAGEDFVATSTKITFRSEETVKICSLTILDDQQRPTVEGNETFIVFLNSVQKAQLIKPDEAVVVLNDTIEDVPLMQFIESSVEVEETSGVVSVKIQRTGDISSGTSVICYTRQSTAVVEEDFVERSLTETSRVYFNPGQTVAFCNVTIIDNGIFESSEQFRIKLASASGDEWYGARVGDRDQVLVTIVNNEDAPTIEFERAEYSIREPDSVEARRQLSVTVIRSGDASEISKVRCSTRDGSAKSGSDYEPKSRMLRFQPGQTRLTFKVNILPNIDTEWQETFLIVLGPHEPVNAILGKTSQTTITILDKDAAGSLVLPSTPVVVSLLHYDDVAVGLETPPSPGYPLICVTPCDPKYPNYVDTQSLCEEAAINSSAIKFSWEVAMPTEQEGGSPPFETVTDSTPFTSVNTKVLDSIYFGRRFHIRCVAQAVDDVTHTGGTPLRSNVVTIATDSGLCHNPIVAGSERGFQAQSFIANLRYLPPTDEEHPNTIHVSVKIPHQDGRLPLISTMPISNLRLLLSRSIDRQQHVCSNLMYSDKQNNSTSVEALNAGIGTNLGFITKTDFSKLSLGPGYDKPYQFDPNVRESKSIDLYKFLNLKSCIWQFDTYYHMNELIDFCNGQLEQDFQRRDAAMSQVTVSVPLYVSYVYVTAPRGWGALDHHTEMQFSFQYSNVVFRAGIQTDGVLKGRVQILRLKLQDDGKLEIQFKTHGLFRGLFVKNHRTLPDRTSRVVAPTGMNVEFTLTNTWSENTFDSPYQLWRAVSTYSRKDYSGEYTIEIIPCTVSQTKKWRPTPPSGLQCTAYSPVKFKIPIMFQQTNRPVPVVYTLETNFQLCNNDKVFMMNPEDFDREMTEYDYTGAFTKGQTIFGRVLWTPSQDLKSAYKLQLEKVYLCTGRDGYIPKFDPTGTVFNNGPQYGCIEPSKHLKHRFLILDRSNRDSEDRYFHDVPFDAYFAADKPEFASMTDIPGVDGFLIKVDSLYKVEAGHQWYMQVLFQIGPEHSLPRVRRSAMLNMGRHNRYVGRHKRSSPTNENSLTNEMLHAGWHDGQRNNGTDMRFIVLDENQLDSGPNVAVIAAVSVVGLAVAIFTATFCCCVVMRRRKSSKADNIEMKVKKLSVDYGDYPASRNSDPQSRNLLHSTPNVKPVVSIYNKTNSTAPLISSKQNNVVVKLPNCKQRKRNLDLQIVNNLRADGDESGTEV